jgi:hypothetical protein
MAVWGDFFVLNDSEGEWLKVFRGVRGEVKGEGGRNALGPLTSLELVNGAGYGSLHKFNIRDTFAASVAFGTSGAVGMCVGSGGSGSSGGSGGCMPPLLLVADSKHHTVHVVDIMSTNCHRMVVGYVGGYGRLLWVQCVAANDTYVGVGCGDGMGGTRVLLHQKEGRASDRCMMEACIFCRLCGLRLTVATWLWPALGSSISSALRTALSCVAWMWRVVA